MGTSIRLLLDFIRILLARIEQLEASSGLEQATGLKILVDVSKIEPGTRITIHRKENGNVSTTLQNDFKLPLVIAPTDKKGNPALVENISWSTSDPNIAAVTASADGLSAEVVPGSGLGAVQVKVTADAKIGTEEKLLTGLYDIEVVAGEAVNLGIVAGTPVPIP